MKTRFVHQLRIEYPPATETVVEARERLRDKFPRAALRRMTHLGLLLGSVLENLTLTADDALVYASTFAETRALEDFLASFPSASPMLFQTSIHPGGIQQVLIGRQQPIARLWPLAGRARLVEQALLTALLEPAPRVAIAGGEERGTWLLEQEMASERACAFGALLTTDPVGAVARVVFNPAAVAGEGGVAPEREGTSTAGDPCPSLPAFIQALRDGQPLAWRSGGGSWKIEWC